MARSSGLGKGLSSIIPGAERSETDTTQGAVLSDVPVASVTPNPNQPRVHFDEESLIELAAVDHGNGGAPTHPGSATR